MSQTCRSCAGINLQIILDLGVCPPSNALLASPADFEYEISYPLRLLFCLDCKLVQTLDFHRGRDLFTDDYPYLSSTSKSWLDHCSELVDQLSSEFALGPSSKVCEIASNDGYLLQFLEERSVPCFGIEPTHIPASISKSKGHSVYQTFLSLESVNEIIESEGLSDIVIGINVFAHVENLFDFTKAAVKLLKPSGVLVVEIQYFADLVKNHLFDTVYHEHFSYFGVVSISNLLSQFGLNIFRIDRIPTHGGSIRVFASSQCRDSKFEVLNYYQKYETHITQLNKLETFQTEVNQIRRNVQKFFYEMKNYDGRFVAYGAAAKGNTLLNFCEIGPDVIEFVVDNAESKIGKYLPGSHIPIRSVSALSSVSSRNLVILPWNIIDEIGPSITKRFNNKFNIFTLLPRISRYN